MAGKTAILSVRILGDSSGAQKAFRRAEKSLDRWEDRTKKAAVAMTAASAGILAFGKKAVDAASDMEQSVGAVESVFKDQSEQMLNWASNAAEAVGLSKNEYNEFATLIGSQLKTLGIPMEQVGDKTNELIGLGADLASMFGGTTADAVSALSAVFRGETNPIERYGVAIKQSDVDARLAAEGLDNLDGDALKLAETEARLALVFEQTADAQGNFARESDTVAHKQQVATAKFEDAKATLGEALLPIMADAADVAADLADKIGENPEKFHAAAAAVLGLTGALWGAWVVMKIVQAGIAIAKGIGIAYSAAAGLVRKAWLSTGALMIGNAVATAASHAAAAAATAAQWVASSARSVAAMVAQRGAAVGAAIAAQVQHIKAAAAVAAAWVVSSARSVAAMVAQRGAMMATAAATKIMAAAQRVLNAVMRANPIGIVITLLAGLVAGLVVAYNKSEGFRNAVQKLGQFIMDWFIGPIKSAIDFLGNFIDMIGRGWNSVTGFIGNLFGADEQPIVYAAQRAQPRMTHFTAAPLDSPRSPAPKLRAAPSVSPAGLPRLNGGAAGGAMAQVVHVDNSIEVHVDGAGIVDERAVAEQIRRVLTRDGRRRGLMQSGQFFR